jgi:hypothetical protein
VSSRYRAVPLLQCSFQRIAGATLLKSMGGSRFRPQCVVLGRAARSIVDCLCLGAVARSVERRVGIGWLDEGNALPGFVRVAVTKR